MGIKLLFFIFMNQECMQTATPGTDIGKSFILNLWLLSRKDIMAPT